MTATEPHPALAAKPAARLVPAAEARASCLDSARNADPDGPKARITTPPHDKT